MTDEKKKKTQVLCKRGNDYDDDDDDDHEGHEDQEISARRWSRPENPAACWDSSATRSTISCVAATDG